MSANKKRILVTGGAGFIGSHFCDHALANGCEVLAFDNLSTGHSEFLSAAFANESFRLVQGDIREFNQISEICESFKPDLIAHFAANADVRKGLEHPRKDLDYNTIGTWNVVEASRLSGCKKLIFSSTGSVYGEPEIFPTPEDCPFPIQTSLYAASKLAGEGILAAYANGYDLNITVFRFVSILGPRYSHGHVFDFVQSLKRDSSSLRVLGDGLQLKSYLHVEDLMQGLWLTLEQDLPGFRLFNIGHDETLTVNRSISIILDELRVQPTLEYTGGTRGWTGDSPRIQLSTTRLRELGWKPSKTLEGSVRETVQYLQENPWLFSEKASL